MAERFELYVRGIELANGYHELLDGRSTAKAKPRGQRRRARPTASRPCPKRAGLLAAMEHGLPACTGVALGFDRLVMLAAGASSLAEVMAFPIERA